MFIKISLQRVKKIGDLIAVQVWMDYDPGTLPEYWREALVGRGVGERKRDGTIRLTRRGRHLRSEIVHARRRGSDAISAAVPPVSETREDAGPAGKGSAPDGGGPTTAYGVISGPRPAIPWREILARCNATADPIHLVPKHRIVP